MILLLFGQPASGKSTIANGIKSYIDADPQSGLKMISIDGDRWRDITQNKDYTREGRIRNLKGAFDMALYLEKEGFLVVLSFVTPYAEMRNYLSQHAEDYIEVYLRYNEDRGRNHFFVQDFEAPSKQAIQLNTSALTLQECIDHILPIMKKEGVNHESHCSK